MEQTIVNVDDDEESLQWLCLGWLDGLADLVWGPEEDTGLHRDVDQQDAELLEQSPPSSCKCCCC